jgi:hypothetical protein
MIRHLAQDQFVALTGFSQPAALLQLDRFREKP